MPIESMLCPKCGKQATEYDENKWRCCFCNAKFIYQPPPDVETKEIRITQKIEQDRFICSSCKGMFPRGIHTEYKCTKCGQSVCDSCINEFVYRSTGILCASCFGTAQRARKLKYHVYFVIKIMIFLLCLLCLCWLASHFPL